MRPVIPRWEQVSQWEVRWECALGHSPWGQCGRSPGLCGELGDLCSAGWPWLEGPCAWQVWGSRHISQTFAQSYKCPWCQKNLFPCGMAVLCQLCCWTCFNDNFLHIPHKTPLQMGCRSRNSIWELGCCSALAVWITYIAGLQLGPPGLGSRELWQASLAHSMNMLDGAWGWMDLREVSAVVRW